MLSCVVIWVRGRIAPAVGAGLDRSTNLRALVIACLVGASVTAWGARVDAQTPDADAPSTWGSGKPPPPPSDDGEAGEAEDEELEDTEPLPPSGLVRPAEPTSDVSDQALRYTLEAVEIRGNTRTRDRVVLRYVPFHVGDVLDVEDPAIELTRYRLLGTGFFRDIQFSLRKGSAGARSSW